MADVYADHMPRVPSEVQRLNDQFDLMTENVGYIIHPAVTLPPSPRIADLGTGSARFLIRIHPSYPDAKLEGYDISSTLFPSLLPTNISLSERDVKQPFPEDLHEKYDLVHARMLVAAMLPGEWEPVVRNLTRLLKPGGYLQWEECDFVSSEWTKSTPRAKFEKSKYMLDLFLAALGERLRYGWNTLPEHMRAAGLTSVVTDVASSDKVLEAGCKLTSTIMTLVFSWARLLVERGEAGSVFDEGLDKLEKEVQEELKSGSYLKYDIHVACGRKAPA
ncbi:S-adenosyl-L-methionine-dependent methyltransferase [Hypoxylon sp. FL1150]|nr:S-adenosyl-L-methionine-dependent methyltransferase [Hypoxylon sp. FL1150]